MRVSWIVRAEDAIRALRDVESASVQSEGDTIREIHILSRSNRPPKQIVRDVQTVLQARFNRSIDYRVVSVAYLTDTSGSVGPSGRSSAPAAPREAVDSAPPPPPPAHAPLPERAAEPAPAPAPERVAEPAAPPAPKQAEAPAREPAPRAAEPPTPAQRPAEGERIRFGSVNLFVAGPRTQAQVELKWRGLPRMGSASGWSTRANVHRLVAQA